MRPLPIAIITGVIILLLGGAVLLTSGGSSNEPSRLDDFARCLSSKGVTMYGTYSCSHCQNMKKAFGSSFQYVNYVECTTQTQKCIDQKIEAYPTWVFSDSSREVGEMSLDKLSQLSGCSLPQ